MQKLKKGDVILVVGYESILATLSSNEDVEHASMMRDSDCVIMAGDWGISPGDLFLCKQGERQPNRVCGNIPKKLRSKIDNRGYWWEVRLKTERPRRTK